MKKCPRCQMSKAYSDFYQSKRHKDGFRPWCKACCSEGNRQYREQNVERVEAGRIRWKIRNPNYLKQYDEARRLARIERKARLIEKYKDGRACYDCSESHPHYVLDFDHRPGEVKRRSVSEMIRNNASEQDIVDEIAKCDLICANCHRYRTARRAGYDRLLESRPL